MRDIFFFASEFSTASAKWESNLSTLLASPPRGTEGGKPCARRRTPSDDETPPPTEAGTGRCPQPAEGHAAPPQAPRAEATAESLPQC